MPTDSERFAIVMNALGAAFNRPITPAVLTAYEMGLDGLAIEEIEAAAKRALGMCKFMPTPAELRELAGGLKPEDQAVLAWETAVGAVQRHGWYRSVQFEDAAITATIRSLGGWQRFCERCGGEEEKWLRQDFLRTYAAYCKVGVSPEAALPLAGEFERQNTLLGYRDRDEDRPALIPCEYAPSTVRRIGRSEAGRKALAIVNELSEAMRVPE